MSEDVVFLEFHCLTVVSIRNVASDALFGDAPAGVGLYLGLNSGTGKNEFVAYLIEKRLQRVSAFYSAAPYVADKPCVFTIDGEWYVRHAAW